MDLGIAGSGFIAEIHGFPQGIRRFVVYIQNDEPAAATGEDGKAGLEIMFAAHLSADMGAKVRLPFATKAQRPSGLWFSPQ